MSARQKEKALGSMTEVVQTVKHPQSHIQTMSHEITNKHDEQENFNLDYILPKSAESQNTGTPCRQTPELGSRVSQSSFCQEAEKKSRKSGRTSLMG